MAIVSPLIQGEIIRSRDIFDYNNKTNIYKSDYYKSVEVLGDVSNNDETLPVRLLVLGDGSAQLHGRFKLGGAIARNTAMFTLPIYANLTTIIQVWKLGNSANDLVTEYLKVEGNSVTATKEIENDSDVWGFVGHSIITSSVKL